MQTCRCVWKGCARADALGSMCMRTHVCEHVEQCVDLGVMSVHMDSLGTCDVPTCELHVPVPEDWQQHLGEH